MAKIFPGRYTTQIEGDFVVFIIGARVNRLLMPQKWMPVFSAMPKMLKELAEKPELGMMYAYNMVGWRTVSLVQYWRSFEQLHAYAHAKELEHLPAWAAFNRAVGGNGTVGIWHETYKVRAGEYECVAVNMPRWGLANAGTHVEAVGRLQSAKSRMGQAE
jgi:hypothetical protein